MTAQTRGGRQAQAARERGMTSATWRAIGTSVQLVVAGAALDEARRAVEQTLAEVDLAVSRFRPDSELSTLPRGRWVTVSPVLHRYLSAGVVAAAQTDGLVDPTVGASLVDLGYDRTFRLVAPEGPAITVSLRPAPGWRQIELTQDQVRIPRGVAVDLGATAKGLAADLAAENAASVAGSVLVSLGGDVAVAGPPPDGGWPVLISDTSDPEIPDVTGQVVVVMSGGLATSGTAARSWRRGDQVIHHLIDPRSGRPTAGPWRTVTVAAASCVVANTASTAAMVLGADAPNWLRSRAFSARLTRDDGTWTTTGDWPTEEAS